MTHIANIADGTRVLDVGCHDGELLVALRSVNPRLDLNGVEVVPTRALYCLARELNVVCGFAEELPHPDGSMDVVVLGEILEHVANVDVCLQEALRVLRPGGMVLISVPFGNWGLGSPDGTPCHVRDINPAAFRPYGDFFFATHMAFTYDWSPDPVGSYLIRFHKRVDRE
jgi:SAM-dependent methyltransferase